MMLNALLVFFGNANYNTVVQSFQFWQNIALLYQLLQYISKQTVQKFRDISLAAAKVMTKDSVVMRSFVYNHRRFFAIFFRRKTFFLHLNWGRA